jgi:hypothetical protein
MVQYQGGPFAIGTGKRVVEPLLSRGSSVRQDCDTPIALLDAQSEET